MRLLSLISSADIGGAEVHVEHIIRHLPAEHIVIALAEGPMLERYRAAGAEVYVVPGSGKMPLHVLPELERIIALERPDVVHTHTPKANLMGSMTRSPASFQRVMTIHGSHRQFASSRAMPAAWYKWADLWAARHASFIIAVCESDRKELFASGFAASRTIVVPNAVPDVGPIGGARESHGDIVWIGRLSPEKCPETMIAIARSICGHSKVDRIRMIGDGPIRHLLPEIDVPKLTLEPPRESIRDVWPSTLVLVNTSQSEGASLVVLEALSAGIPVVASAVGGNPELIGGGGVVIHGAGHSSRGARHSSNGAGHCSNGAGHSSNGAGNSSLAANEKGAGLSRSVDAVTENERIGLFASAIKRLLDDAEYRRETSERARARYVERFRIEMMVETLLRVYRNSAACGYPRRVVRPGAARS